MWRKKRDDLGNILCDESNSFLFLGFGNLLLALNFTILGLVLFLFLCHCRLVLLVLCFKSGFGCRVYFLPFFANDAGQVSNFGGGVLGLDIVIDLLAVEEEC